MLPTVVDRCHRFDFGRPTVEQVATVLAPRRRPGGDRRSRPGALALIARHATGSFRDALGTLEQLVTYAGGSAIEPADVLAVLGVADAEQLFDAARRDRRPRPGAARCGRPPRSRTRAAIPASCSATSRCTARELLAVQVLGERPRRASGHARARQPARRAGRARSPAPTRCGCSTCVVGGARRDRERRPGPDPARAGAGQGGRARSSIRRRRRCWRGSSGSSAAAAVAAAAPRRRGAGAAAAAR